MILKQDSRIILSEKRKEEYLNGKKLSRYSITEQDVGEHPTRHLGSLHVFCETTLAPQNKDQMTFDKDMQLLILPIIGRVLIHTAKTQNVVDVGEALTMWIKSKEPFTLYNDFENSDVHYVIAGFSSSEPLEGITRFSLLPDKLATLFDKVSNQGLMKAAIGQWNGRAEGKFIPTAQKVFAWVVQGAFEVENCLLQKADGLAMHGQEKIEFEALSNEAIIIFLEMA